MHIRINKVKLDGKGFPTIFYEQSSTYGEPECKLVGTQVSEKLNEAMQALLNIGIEWCHLDRDEWKESGQVSGVTLKHIEGDLGVTIVLRGDFPDEIGGFNYAVNIVTPYLNPDRLTAAQHVEIAKICEEAEGYIKGQPLQLSLAA